MEGQYQPEDETNQYNSIFGEDIDGGDKSWVPAGHNRGADVTTTADTHPLEPATHTLPSLDNATVGQYEPARHTTGAYALSPANTQLAPSGHVTGAVKPTMGHKLPTRHNWHPKASLL